jgi:hypothetical protein
MFINKIYQKKYIFALQIAAPMECVIIVANTPARPFTAAIKEIKKYRTFPVKRNRYQEIPCLPDDFAVIFLQ